MQFIATTSRPHPPAPATPFYTNEDGHHTQVGRGRGKERGERGRKQRRRKEGKRRKKRRIYWVVGERGERGEMGKRRRNKIKRRGESLHFI